MDTNSIINISIDLGKVDKTQFKTTDTGKTFMNLTVAPLREPDKYGNTHSVYHAQTKEERTGKRDKIYVGNGKIYTFDGGVTASSAAKPQTFHAAPSNLPF